MLNNLLYRRQYLITNQSIDTNNYPFMSAWRTTPLKDGTTCVYSHPDLAFCYTTKEDVEIILLGYIADARHPSSNNQQITDILVENTSFEECLRCVRQYGGRYMLLYKNAHEFQVINDALAMREIYYLFATDKFWIASQPHFIGNFTEIAPRKDKDFNTFFYHPNFSNTDYAMTGNETCFEGVYHLQPNHYLDIAQQKKVRYFPTANLPEIDLEEAVSKLVPMFKGFLQSASQRYDLMIALTGGWDSRLTVAASRDISSKVKYFIHKFPHLTEESPDIFVPQKLAKKLGFNLAVIPISVDKTSAEFQEFEKIAKQNYYLGNNYIHAHYHSYKNYENKAVVMTNGSEITRNLYQEQAKPYHKFTDADLFHISWQPVYAYNYIIKQCKNWLNDLRNTVQDCNVSVYDLFFWEQRVGNFGSVGSSRNDMSLNETISIFSCHSLLTLMLSVNPKYRKKYTSVLFRRLIEEMWKEMLTEPVNPPTSLRGKIKLVFKKMELLGLLAKIKKTTSVITTYISKHKYT